VDCRKRQTPTATPAEPGELSLRFRDISEKGMPVMYASEIAEQEIREQIRDADENVYKRGFVVDVSAQKSGERIIAYAVTDFHSVIELD
jgi:hypothetical protein